MNKIFFLFLIIFIPISLYIYSGPKFSACKCSKNCKVCKICKYCKHCSKQGLKCLVCNK